LHYIFQKVDLELRLLKSSDVSTFAFCLLTYLSGTANHKGCVVAVFSLIRRL